MAEKFDFESCHVPQQSRRDKLRAIASQYSTHSPNFVEIVANLHSCAGLYDPGSSFISSSDLLAPVQRFHCQSNTNSTVDQSCKEMPTSTCAVDLMGFVGDIVNGNSSSTTSSSYLDPHSSNFPLNPSSVHDISTNPFIYQTHGVHNLRDFNQHQQHYNDGHEMVPFKPEPLSLSLSSHTFHTASNQNSVPLELNLQRYEYGSSIYGPSFVGSVSRSSGPLGPFTGYASILKGSRFLKPAQQLLEEFCDVGHREIYAEKITADSSLMGSQIESFKASGVIDDELSVMDGSESRIKKYRLVSMLDEVYRRYQQYYQQLQVVVMSFECVAGLNNAAPYANSAVKAMTKHFRSLKNVITDQIRCTNKDNSNLSQAKEDASMYRSINRGLYSQRPIQYSGLQDHQPVWRPQRGLPERAVTVLRAWLFEHFLHPYPTDTDKMMLAKQTGLSRSQVSNWFINARVRLWKPMVEEIHMLETRQAQKETSHREDQNVNVSSSHIPLSNSFASENPLTSSHRTHDSAFKCTRDEVPDIPMENNEQMNLSYNHLPSHMQVGVGMNVAGGSSSGVSLTLGLHQNNVIGMSDPFPVTTDQRFDLGVEGSQEGYMMGGFQAQNRHFGRHIIGGQYLHDFVG